MPNHEKPIEECELWDVLDWDVVATLSCAESSQSNPKSNPPAVVARKLIELGSKEGKEDEQFFHRVFTRFVTAGSAADRREQAGALADMFGARPDRLIDFVAFKWGLFRRASRPTR
jgi:hypothetical protein